jgi:hypothetical protein
MSLMYAAPEIIAKYKRHGRGSDISALGGVFRDMLTIMEDRSVESFQESLLGDHGVHAQDPVRPDDELDEDNQIEARESPPGPKPSYQPKPAPYRGALRYSHELGAINS